MRKHKKASTKTPQVTTITLAEDRSLRNFARKHPRQWRQWRRETAIHEAAHAVVALAFGHWFHSVSIKPDGGLYGRRGHVEGNDGAMQALFTNRTTRVAPKSAQSATRRSGIHNAKRFVVGMLAGHMAEMLNENPKATTADIVDKFFEETMWDDAGENGTDTWKAGLAIGNWLVGRRPIIPLSPDDFDSPPIYPILKHYLAVTIRLLRKSRTWKMVQRVAAELVRLRSDMSMDDVLALAHGSKEFERRYELRIRAERSSYPGGEAHSLTAQAEP